MREGAKITGNNGGGIYVDIFGTFTMSGGEIYGNTSLVSGGGVYVDAKGTFTMSGGEIYSNTADGDGGGVLAYGTFTMTGGKIYSNTAIGGGGGVYAHGTRTKTGGGIIYGYVAGDPLSNTVTNADGEILPNKGHAVYVDSSSTSSIRRCEATVDASHNLDGSKAGAAGGWDVQ